MAVCRRWGGLLSRPQRPAESRGAPHPPRPAAQCCVRLPFGAKIVLIHPGVNPGTEQMLCVVDQTSTDQYQTSPASPEDARLVWDLENVQPNTPETGCYRTISEVILVKEAT